MTTTTPSPGHALGLPAPDLSDFAHRAYKLSHLVAGLDVLREACPPCHPLASADARMASNALATLLPMVAELAQDLAGDLDRAASGILAEGNA